MPINYKLLLPKTRGVDCQIVSPDKRCSRQLGIGFKLRSFTVCRSYRLPMRSRKTKQTDKISLEKRAYRLLETGDKP